jgi:hypothetical protein
MLLLYLNPQSPQRVAVGVDEANGQDGTKKEARHFVSVAPLDSAKIVVLLHSPVALDFGHFHHCVWPKKRGFEQFVLTTTSRAPHATLPLSAERWG